MDRRKNDASTEDLCKVLRFALPNGVSAAFKAMSMEEVVQEHEELLKGYRSFVGLLQVILPSPL